MSKTSDRHQKYLPIDRHLGNSWFILSLSCLDMASLSLAGLEPHRAPLATASEVKGGYGHIQWSGFWFIWYLLCGFWTLLKISVTVLPWWVTECSHWSADTWLWSYWPLREVRHCQGQLQPSTDRALTSSLDKCLCLWFLRLSTCPPRKLPGSGGKHFLPTEPSHQLHLWTDSHVGLELHIFLPQLPGYGDYRNSSSCLALTSFSRGEN